MPPDTVTATPQPTPPATRLGSGRLLVVFGTKGGVGKTVVATNIAASLAMRLKKPVCLIDLDVMAVGDVAKMLNIDRKSVV